MSNIIFCGFPRVGKSFWAKKIAPQIGYLCVDLDEWIAPRAREFYQTVGEEKFRCIEKKTLFKLRILEKSILAVGGGCVLDRQNVFLLKKMGRLIFLDFEKEEIKKRALTKPYPCCLDEKFPESSFEDLYKRRGALYKEVADIRVCNHEELWEVIRLGKYLPSPPGESRMEELLV